MKRFGLALVAMAAVSFMAGRAEAQTGVTDAVLNATADIEAILEFVVDDDTINCGSVVVGETICNDEDAPATTDAQVTVTANSDWLLTFQDLGGATAFDVVTLTNQTAGRDGQFTLDITSDAPDGFNGGTADANVVVVISGTPTGSSGVAGDDVDVTDDNGPYAGTFDVTITATN